MNTALSCTVCSARGFLGERRCPNCRGSSFVLFVGDALVGWNRPLDRFSIAARRTGVRANAGIDIVLAVVSVLGVAQLVFAVLANPLTLITSSFWGGHSTALFFFWLSMLTLWLLVSRRRRARIAFVPIKRRSYDAEAPVVRTPTGWEEARLAKHVIDASRSFTPAALRAVELAATIAETSGHASVEAAHLFAALLRDKQILVIFARGGVAISGVAERVERLLAKQTAVVPGAAPSLSPEVQSIILNAYAVAAAARADSTDVAELMLGVAENAQVSVLLEDVGLVPEIFANVVEWVRINRDLRNRITRYRSRALLKPKGAMDRAMTAIATPILDAFSHDLTAAARVGNLPFMVDRESEMSAIFRVIEGGRSSAVLVGEPGVGKETILAGIAERMVEEDVPAILKDKRLVAISVGDLVAGASAAEAGDRLLRLLDEVARAGNIVLAVQNVDAFVGVSEGGVDLSDTFAAELGRGYFFCVATATPSRYKLFEGRPIGNALQKIEVREPEPQAAIRIIMAIVGGIEAQQGVFFTYQAIERAVLLSSKYLHERYLPEKAVEILREAAQLARKNKGANSLVEGEDVAVIVSEKSHVPVTAVTAEETDKLLNLEEKMHERVVGQAEAVTAVANALKRARAELRSKNRPIASFLFLGPTGVGKTELAKTVAAVYFNNETAMVRLDMSEYQESASITRLIGAPGMTGGGLLTEAIRKSPFTLLLLDEFEKAHPEILNVFLQVMDDGRLTDNQGRTIDFTNIIIVATSNAGSQFIQDAIRAGKALEEIKSELLNEKLKGIYRPELLNRFDGVIVFRPLTADEIEQIAWLMMGSITDLLKTRGINFRATDTAVRELAAVGFDPVFGARPMRRVIQEKVENALAEELLRNKLGRRDTVIFDAGGTIRIEKAKEI